MANYIASDTDLTSVANAIRAKSGGSSQLAFPAGFVSEIGNIPSGGGGMQSYDVVITATIRNTQQLFNMLVTSPQDNHIYIFEVKSAEDDALYNYIRAGTYCRLSKFGVTVARAIRYRNRNESTEISNSYDAAVTVGDVYTVWYSEVY